jgi:cytochrome c biogenesis protein CcdA
MSLELLGTSVLSGFFAAFSPCNVPLLPVILNILAAEPNNRARSAVAFSLGLMAAFTVFYVAVGFALKLFLGAVDQMLGWFYVAAYAAAALICILFAMQSAGLLRFWTRTYSLKHNPRGGFFGSLLTGAFFATIASPCNTAFIMTGILPVLLSKATVLEGLFYMAAFSASMSVPVLLIGLLTGRAIDKWLMRHARRIEQASALFLAAAAAYFIYLAITLAVAN